MTGQRYSDGPLGDLRVLELADEKGQWCGKLLADLGADVIKVEPPGGAPERRVGPFYHDQPHPERSLYFWHYNTSKRGITLDIEQETGRDLLRRLAGTSDILLETYPPGYLSNRGLGYEQISALNSSIIVCSLTPFGQNGPWAQFQISDLLQLAAGGHMAQCGYEEKDIPSAPPIAPGGGNAWHLGCHFAFIAIGAALHQRHVTGQGQHLDVSIHEVCSLNTQQAIVDYLERGTIPQRRTGGGGGGEGQFKAGDGKYIRRDAVGARTRPDRLRAVAEWMGEHGMAEDLLDDRYLESKFIAANADHVNQIVGRFLSSISAEEAYHGGQTRLFNWMAVRTVEENLADPHWQDRKMWEEVEHPELGQSFTYPASYALFSDTPIKIYHRAPRIGEHNEEILCRELGLTRLQLAVLAEGGIV